jgi:hypothetical protein
MVARTIADPPLAVLCTLIRSVRDQSLGYMVVRIPPSSTAPHMVEHRYLGRGDKTKFYLSDSDVLRLHEQRNATQRDALALLREQFGRDPIPAEDRKQGHLFLLAQPSVLRPQMFLDLVHGQEAPTNLLNVVRHADTPEMRQLLKSTGDFSPSLTYASDFAFRSAGAALSYGLASGRPWAPSGASPEDVVELEVDEDGGLRIFMSRLSDSLRSADPSEKRGAPPGVRGSHLHPPVHRADHRCSRSRRLPWELDPCRRGDRDSGPSRPRVPYARTFRPSSGLPHLPAGHYGLVRRTPQAARNRDRQAHRPSAASDRHIRPVR